MRVLIQAMAFLGAVGVLVLAVVYSYFATYEPNRENYPVRGIDVSHHQGTIDWPEVASDDVEFAFMKATEGGDFVDPRFQQNWRESDQAGIPRGAYHFFTYCRPAKEQAANFIATVPREAQSLPPVLDLEYLGNCRARPSIEEMRREILTWLDRVESHYGQGAILYVTHEFYDAYLSHMTIDRQLWLRSLVREPSFARPWTIWQYHNRGSVRGIEGPVDLNIARAAELDAMTAGLITP